MRHFFQRNKRAMTTAYIHHFIYPFLGYFPIQLISITPQLTFEQPKREFSIKFLDSVFDFSILTTPCNTPFLNKMPLFQGMIPKSILSCNVSILPLHEKHKACTNPSPPFDLQLAAPNSQLTCYPAFSEFINTNRYKSIKVIYRLKQIQTRFTFFSLNNFL